jgi:hypothetical protein
MAVTDASTLIYYFIECEFCFEFEQTLIEIGGEVNNEEIILIIKIYGLR